VAAVQPGSALVSRSPLSPHSDPTPTPHCPRPPDPQPQTTRPYVLKLQVLSSPRRHRSKVSTFVSHRLSLSLSLSHNTYLHLPFDSLIHDLTYSPPFSPPYPMSDREENIPGLFTYCHPSRHPGTPYCCTLPWTPCGKLCCAVDTSCRPSQHLHLLSDALTGHRKINIQLPSPPRASHDGT